MKSTRIWFCDIIVKKKNLMKESSAQILDFQNNTTETVQWKFYTESDGSFWSQGCLVIIRIPRLVAVALLLSMSENVEALPEVVSKAYNWWVENIQSVIFSTQKVDPDGKFEFPIFMLHNITYARKWFWLAYPHIHHIHIHSHTPH